MRSKQTKTQRLLKQAEYREANREKIRKSNRDYYARTKASKKKPDPEARRAYMRDYKKKRRAEDVQYRLGENLRSRLGLFFSGVGKYKPTQELVGCSWSQLREHLETLFQLGMSWENYGLWHVDHKIPLSSVDLSDKDKVLEVCHYTNLQPLWAADNISKGARIVS